MKCLLVSDLHYTLKQFDWLCTAAEALDPVTWAGQRHFGDAELLRWTDRAVAGPRDHRSDGGGDPVVAGRPPGGEARYAVHPAGGSCDSTVGSE
jgi:hypothetical protein